MDVHATLEAPCGAAELFAFVDDLAKYPAWKMCIRDRRYSEAMVNLILGQRHPDTAALRRYLVDEGFLDRSDGQYWRSGGSITAPPGP